MKYSITTSNIESTTTVNITSEEDVKRIKRDIRNCIENRDVHNRIVCDGKVLFTMGDIFDIEQEIKDRHKTYVPYTEDEKMLGLNVLPDGTHIDGRHKYDTAAIKTELAPIIDKMVEEIYNEITGINDRVRSWSAQTTVGLHGNSLVANITQGCRMLGVDRGDIIKITVEKVKK